MNGAVSKRENSVPLTGKATTLLDLGTKEYLETYDLQKAWVERKKAAASEPDLLLLVEHPEVFTYGRKCGAVTQINDGKKRVAIERGGDVTFHNPGQLVCYPLLQLEGIERSVPVFLRKLEEVLILTLANFGIEAGRKPSFTGVWVGNNERKIASLGVAITRWITYHGSALNVDNDLSGFFEINPCGLPSSIMTSMKKELGEECPSISEVKVAYVRHFSKVFQRPVG